MKTHFLIAAIFVAQTALLSAPTTSPKLERRVIAGPESAKEWSPAESTVQSSRVRRDSGQASLHWHVTVDHTAGEPKYPIGWPRFSRPIRDAADRDWSGWDFLHFRIYTDTSRAELPREPVGMILYTPDKAGAWHRPLHELQKGQWIEFRIPLSEVPRHHDVRSIQFHIAESKYRHQDTLDLYLEDIALLRYAEPTLLEFAPENAVMFSDARFIPLRVQLTGVKAKESFELQCELRRDRRIVAQMTVRTTRGAQRVLLDVQKTKLTAGDYELVARLPAGNQETARLRIVTSPWQ